MNRRQQIFYWFKDYSFLYLIISFKNWCVFHTKNVPVFITCLLTIGKSKLTFYNLYFLFKSKIWHSEMEQWGSFLLETNNAINVYLNFFNRFVFISISWVNVQRLQPGLKQASFTTYSGILINFYWRGLEVFHTLNFLLKDVNTPILEPVEMDRHSHFWSFLFKRCLFFWPSYLRIC